MGVDQPVTTLQRELLASTKQNKNCCFFFLSPALSILSSATKLWPGSVAVSPLWTQEQAEIAQGERCALTRAFRVQITDQIVQPGLCRLAGSCALGY